MTGAARYPPPADPGPGVAPGFASGAILGAAGWIVAAGLSVSLHILALTGLVLGLIGQPQAPAAPGTGLVIKTLPPVTGSAPRLTRPDLARSAARQSDSPARDRLTALEESPTAAAPETPRSRAARVAGVPAERSTEIRRATPTTSPTQGATMRLTAARPTDDPRMRPTAIRPSDVPRTAAPALRPAAPSSRPDTVQARRVVPVQAVPRLPVRDPPGSAQTADDPAPRRLAPSEARTPERAPVRTPVRAERLRAEVPRAAAPRADSRAEARADPPEAIRPERSERSEPADRAQPEAARRLSPAPSTAPARTAEATRIGRATSPPPASVLAPTRRLATATRPQRGSAPVPQDTRDPASRARRDGPDRRLSDRRAAPAAAPGGAALDDARAGPELAAALAALHARAGAPCHTAQPLIRAGAAPAIAIFGPDRARLAEARRTGEAPDESWPDMAARPVTQAQCPALDFIREAGDDPTDGIRLDLWSPTAGDRQPLTGVIAHDGPPALHLLLIDTAGQVHDLAGFLQPVPDGSQFSVPMTGAGEAGNHHQLLLAIAAPSPLPLPEVQRSQARTAPAGPFFAALQAALAREGITPDLALAGFVFE